MSKYLVTGGAGFIGSHIAAALVDRGDSVCILDDLSTGNLDNLQSYRNDIEFVRGDLRDEDCLAEVVKDVEVIFHEAALVSVAMSVQQPLLTEDINVVGTLKLLLAARDADVRRVVYASSAAVYGSSPELPKVETMTPYPTSPYGYSKLASEHYGRIFTELYGLETVGLRYFNVLGPRQSATSEYSGVIARFIHMMMRGIPPAIYGDGMQTRDFVHVDNVVAANLLAARANMSGAIFNVATGGTHTLLDVVGSINRNLGTHLAPTFGPPRPGDIQHSAADISLIKRRGYQPEVGFEPGLADTIKWYQMTQRN